MVFWRVFFGVEFVVEGGEVGLGLGVGSLGVEVGEFFAFGVHNLNIEKGVPNRSLLIIIEIINLTILFLNGLIILKHLQVCLNTNPTHSPNSIRPVRTPFPNLRSNPPPLRNHSRLAFPQVGDSGFYGGVGKRHYDNEQIK